MQKAFYLTRDIEARIVHAKQTREWEDSYMTFREYYAEEFQEAIDENTAKVTANERSETAKRMLSHGFSIEDTADCTRLSIAEVKAIAAGLR